MRRLRVDQLQVGMYVQELCGNWFDSPFWKKSFPIDTRAKLDAILSSKITAAVIDPARGLDLAEDDTPDDDIQAEPAAPAASGAPFRYAPVQASTMDAELGRAGVLLSKSKEAVCTMFQEARMGRAIALESAQPLVDEIALSVMRNPDALVGLVRLKSADDYTYMHSVAVCALMIALARQLGLADEETRELGLAGLLHDIGKMQVASEILNKEGKLTDDEFVSVKMHPVAGHAMLLQAHSIGPIALEVCLHHHEKMDGSGYPDGLAGEQISLHARMGAICDVYDAITSDRPYKRGWCPAESLQKMTQWCLGHFDPALFGAFVKCMGIYPVGTLVRLKSGFLAVVVDHRSGKALVKPLVRVFFCTSTKAPVTPRLLDLAAPGDAIFGREDAAPWGITDLAQYWLPPELRLAHAA